MGKNVESTKLTDTNRKAGIIVDKCGAGDQTSRKGHKHSMLDEKNAVTWTSKKSKVSFGWECLLHNHLQFASL